METQATKNTFVSGLFIGTVLGAIAVAVGTLYGIYDESHDSDRKQAEAVKEEPTPAWAQGFKLDCIGTKENQLCKDMETGCQYLWPSDGHSKTSLAPRLTAQGKPMCGGTQ